MQQNLMLEYLGVDLISLYLIFHIKAIIPNSLLFSFLSIIQNQEYIIPTRK